MNVHAINVILKLYTIYVIKYLELHEIKLWKKHTGDFNLLLLNELHMA